MTGINAEIDIIEAIRKFEPNNQILKLKEFPNAFIRRNNDYEVLGTENGHGIIIPKSHMIFTHYRGENDIYPTSVPSIYRNNPSEIQILIDKLKIIDFILIAKTFPQIQFAEKDKLNINYDALAQHYGLRTDIVDVTFDIIIAAFFATHEYDLWLNTYLPKSSGYGVLSSFIGLDIDPNEDFEIIGVQPFKRPGIQQAMGLRLNRGDDYKERSCNIIFEQNVFWNKKIGDLLKMSNINLFPHEVISGVADKIKAAKSVTETAVMEYCNKNNESLYDVKSKVLGAGYKIINEPLFTLSDELRKMLEDETNERLYGLF